MGFIFYLFVYLHVNCWYSAVYLFIWLFICLCLLFIYLVRVYISSYLLGGFLFLLSLQPTTTGVILSLYFIVDVRWEVKKTNRLDNWVPEWGERWSSTSWVGIWATSNITPHWWQKVILNFHFLIARHWWSSQYSCRPLWFSLICKAMDNIVQSCHSDGKYISTPKSWWGDI